MRIGLLTVAGFMMAAGCTTYQHPEPTQAKDALKQAMNEQQKQAAPLTALPKSVQSELLQLNRPQMPVGMPEKRLYYILLKWSNRDLWDYGVNARWGWFTSKGLAAGREANRGDEEPRLPR